MAVVAAEAGGANPVDPGGAQTVYLDIEGGALLADHRAVAAVVPDRAFEFLHTFRG
jgi:hypothetical protein